MLDYLFRVTLQAIQKLSRALSSAEMSTPELSDQQLLDRSAASSGDRGSASDRVTQTFRRERRRFTLLPSISTVPNDVDEVVSEDG